MNCKEKMALCCGCVRLNDCHLDKKQDDVSIEEVSVEEFLESTKQVMIDVDKSIMKCNYNSARRMLSEHISKIESFQL